MQDKAENSEQVFNAGNPLKHLTPAQFMALGGNAVVYIKTISGADLSKFMVSSEDLADEAQFQLVVSADGSPLMVGDTTESVAEWLGERNYGVVALH